MFQAVSFAYLTVMSDPFSAASSTVGVVSLGLTVCQGLLEYYGSWKSYRRDIDTTCGSLASLISTISLLSAAIHGRVLDNAAVTRVQECINSCQDGIRHLEKKLDKVKGCQLPVSLKDTFSSQTRRLFYPFKISTLAKLHETVSDLQGNLSLAIQVLQM
jgi:hypothetical protein